MAKEKFLLVSLKEEESKHLAQVISSDTARKILDTLAEKEHTESDLAKELSIPLSTVHYNLQALLKAKLVEAEEFHYSAKGKEVLHYKLANKYIIIAPKSTFGIKEKLKSILPVLALAIAGTWIFTLLQNTGMRVESVRFAADKMAVPTQEAGIAMTQTAQEAGTSLMQTAGSQVAFFPVPPAIWFLVGTVYTLVMLLLIEFIRYKRGK